jgi:hypothetical protein
VPFQFVGVPPWALRYATHLLALLVLGLSMTDGLATLRLIAAGIEEANPVMRALLACGPGQFLLGKLPLTAGALTMLVAARRRPMLGARLRTPHGLLCLAAVYAAVVVYDLALLKILVS